MSRRLVWLVFAIGAAASLAANILHAHPNPISRVIAGWPPVALLLTVELISRIPATSRWRSGVRLTATAAIAGIAAWVSYWHMVEVIRRYGEDTTAAHLLPLSVDGLMVVASVCLVEVGSLARKPSPVVEAIPRMAPATAQPARADVELAAAPNPRGYVKATARDVIGQLPGATVPELAAALVAATGTHPKHARATVRRVLTEGAPA